MKTIIQYKHKKINLEVKEVGFFGKIIGLIFSSRNCKNLLFSFSKPVRVAIHSLFVFYPFLAVYLDEKNKVNEFILVKPFSFHIIPEQKFKKIIEIPINSKNRRVIDTFME